MRAPTEAQLRHKEWKCFSCNYTACKTCSPSKYLPNTYRACGFGPLDESKDSIYNYPSCNLGQCSCRNSYKSDQYIYSCSAKCKQFARKYCLSPYRYHKQCFRLQLQRMLNNYKGAPRKTGMREDEHSYPDLQVEYEGYDSESDTDGDPVLHEESEDSQEEIED